MTPADLAVVIPTLNEAGWIGRSAGEAMRQGAGQVIVADGGSTDGTPDMVPPGARLVRAPRGRGAQMNAGAMAADLPGLLFLHADTILPAHGLAAAAHALARPGVAAGCFRLRLDTPTPLLRLYGWCTHLPWRVLRYGDQGLFMTREMFFRVGGFPLWPLMEDVDMVRRLSRQGRVAVLPLCVTTSARRFRRRGVIRQQALNSSLVLRFWLGADPRDLARRYL